MKTNKKVGILLFGFMFIMLFSMLAFNVTTFNSVDPAQGCACHQDLGYLEIACVNGTTIYVNKSADFKLGFHANTSLTGDRILRVRFLLSNIEYGVLTFTPDMVAGDSGIADGGPNDPNPSADRIGSAANPAIVSVSNVPNTDKTFLIAMGAYDFESAHVSGEDEHKAEIIITVVVGAGSEVPGPWDWLLDHMPVIIIISVLFIIGISISVVTRRVYMGKPEVEKIPGKK
ncbi:MAG: hypothetical protein HWN65_07870 [Candidatus Helarchaeota archaeon]|nr:hypothetical protein [Candidatus Helarchaeota archaeon]